MYRTERFFNTAGPIKRDLHYNIDPLKRIELDEIEILIHQQKYFVLHAPRQTGKTSCLLALRDYLNAQGDYWAVYANVEAGQAYRNDVLEVNRSVVGTIAEVILSFSIGTQTSVGKTSFGIGTRIMKDISLECGVCDYLCLFT